MVFGILELIMNILLDQSERTSHLNGFHSEQS
jgi:hypothetical protein